MGRLTLYSWVKEHFPSLLRDYYVDREYFEKGLRKERKKLEKERVFELKEKLKKFQKYQNYGKTDDDKTQTSHYKLNKADISIIMTKYFEEGKSQKQIAKDFGITQGTVSWLTRKYKDAYYKGELL